MRAIVLIYVLTCRFIFADSDIRYFGGLSNGDLSLAKSAVYSAPLVVTEEVFVAKSSNEIDIIVEKQKDDDILKKKDAVEFISEKSGHLYGGLSEGKLNF